MQAKTEQWQQFIVKFNIADICFQNSYSLPSLLPSFPFITSDKSLIMELNMGSSVIYFSDPI